MLDAVEVEQLSVAEPSADRTRGGADEVLDSREAGGRILRGGVLRFGAYALQVSLSVLSAGLLTRHLGVTRFGQYTTALSLVSVVAAITDSGMFYVGTREYAVRGGARRDALMRDLLGLRMALSVLGVALIASFALAAGYDTALLVGVVLASLGTIALVVQHTHTIPISAELRLGTLSALELARQALSVAAIVALVLFGAGVLPLLAVALAVNVVLIAPTAALAHGRIALDVGLSPRRWLALLRLAVAFSLATAVGTVYIFTAQIITSLIASAHQSGLFAASFRIFQVLAAVPALLAGGALPLLARAARDDRDRLAYALQRIFEASLIVGVAASLGVLNGAQFMIGVVAGPKYSGSVEVLQIQGIALVASFVLAGWSFALLSLERYRAVLLANLAAFVVSCAATLALAGSHGASGAAVATVCGESVLALGSLLALVHGHPELRPRLRIVPRVALAATPGVLLGLATSVPSLPRTLLALAAFALLALLTRAVPAEVIRLMPWRR